jgi:type IV secretory pathway TrbD component
VQLFSIGVVRNGIKALWRQALGTNESETRTGIVADKTRWLAIVTGCITAVTGFVGITWLITIIPILLILGAIAQPRFPRAALG